MSRWASILVLMCISAIPYAADKPVITVLDLQVDQVSDSEMRTVISLLSSALFKTGRFTVIDVSERENLLKEIEFSTQDCTDEGCQLEIGKLLAAEYIVVGRFGKLGKKYILSVKMLETATSRTVSTADGSYGELDEIVDDMPALAGELSGVAPAPASTTTAAAPSAGPAETPKPPPAPRKPIAPVRIAAFSSAGAAVVCAGVAVPLLVGAIRYLQGPVETAFQDYMDEEEGSLLIPDKYTAYLDEFGTYQGKLIPGIALAGGSIALGVLSAVLFTRPVATDAPAVAMSVGPSGHGVTLSLRLPAGRRTP